MLPVIEIVANFMFSGLAIYYMNTVLERGAKTVRWKMVLFWLLYFGVVTFLTYPDGFEGLWAIAYGITLFVYSCMALYGKALVKLVYAALWNIILVISSAVVLFTSKIIVDRNLYSIYDVKVTVRVIELLSGFLLRLILINLLVLVKEQRKKTGEHNIKFTIMLILIYTITWGNLMGMLMAEMNAIQSNRYIWVLLLFIELAICLLLLFYLYDRWSRIEQEKLINEHLMTMNEEQERYIRELISGAEEIGILKHDMKKYFFVLHTYISNGQIEESKKYLEELRGSSDEIPIGEYHSLQAILKNRKMICEKEGICFQYSVLGNWEKIDTMDLCVLSWNMLDNAVEAERKESEKEIQFEISNYRGYLKLECRNRIQRSVLEENPNLITSKKDKNNHGLGLASVRKMVEKYNGMQKITEEEGFFIISAYLQNN